MSGYNMPIIQLDHQIAEQFELCSLIDSHNYMMLCWPDIIAGICYKSPVHQISCSLWALCKPNQDIIFNHVTDWRALVETSFLICQTGANASVQFASGGGDLVASNVIQAVQSNNITHTIGSNSASVLHVCSPWIFPYGIDVINTPF